MTPKIILNIASVQRRKPFLMQVLQAMATQTIRCDHINLALSYEYPDKDITDFLTGNFSSPLWKWGDFTSDEKYFNLDYHSDNSYFLTIDDDIHYPDNYIKLIITGIEEFYRQAVVSMHGFRYAKFPVTDYLKRENYQYMKEVAATTRVDVAGTDCMGFYTGTMRKHGLTFKTLDTGTNQIDNVLSRFCRDNKILMFVLKHRHDQLSIIPGSQDERALWQISANENYVNEYKYLDR